MKTEREKRLEAALRNTLKSLREFTNEFPYALVDADEQAIVEAERLLADEGSGGGDDERVPMKCPSCGSPSPERHPAVQFEGEVMTCHHPWHQHHPADLGQKVKSTDDTPPQRREALEAFDRVLADDYLYDEREDPREQDKALIRQQLSEPAVPSVPESVRRLPEQLRVEALKGCPAEYADRGMARNWAVSEPPDRGRRAERLRIANMIDRALAQTGVGLHYGDVNRATDSWRSLPEHLQQKITTREDEIDALLLGENDG